MNQPQSEPSTSLQILKDILAAGRSIEQGYVDAVHYRAQHDEQLDLLDQLERRRYLRKDHADRYWVSLCELATLDDPIANELLERFEKIFAVLRIHYKSTPKVQIKVVDLATAGFTFEQVKECLGYMLEGQWWSGCSDLRSPDAYVQPSEEILKYKTFQDVIAQLKRQRESHELELRAFEQFRGENPLAAVASATLGRLDVEHIKEDWQKALKRCFDDPDGAITAARTLLESVCKSILDYQDVKYDDNTDLPKLYRLAAEQLQLAPRQNTEKVFKQILGGCQTVIVGLATMRNRLSDAHGKGTTAIKPAPRHGELAVNLAGTVATFLIETWEAMTFVKRSPHPLSGCQRSCDNEAQEGRE